MMWRTHLLCGISTLWLLTLLPPDVLSVDYGAMALGAALGALLPDAEKVPIFGLKPGSTGPWNEAFATCSGSVINIKESGFFRM